jgi:hydroxymethylglutaryl-CoA synthase
LRNIGRYALILTADLEGLVKGRLPVRATAGSGAVAILLGPNAPIIFDDIRATYMDNTYDFYKPQPGMYT